MKWYLAVWRQYRGIGSKPHLYKFSVADGEEVPSKEEVIKASGTTMTWNSRQDKWEVEECGQLAWQFLERAQTVAWGERGQAALAIRTRVGAHGFRERQRELWLQANKGMGPDGTMLKIKLAEDGCGTYVPGEESQPKEEGSLPEG